MLPLAEQTSVDEAQATDKPRTDENKQLSRVVRSARAVFTHVKYHVSSPRIRLRDDGV